MLYAWIYLNNVKFYNLITKINPTYEKDSSFPIRNFMAEGSSFLTMKR